jgi:glycerol uptake facilitator-like aquaporin
MVFMILAPAAFKFSDGAQGKVVQTLFSTFAFRSFYVAFFIYVLVITFRKISTNFNPVVSIVHMVRKDDDFITGAGKIVMQFAGAFAASYLAYHFATMMGT